MDFVVTVLFHLFFENSALVFSLIRVGSNLLNDVRRFALHLLEEAYKN